MMEIKPFEKVGDVCFGMMREDVREIMGQFLEFRKSRFSKNTSDKFLTATAFYDETNRIEALEFFRGTPLSYKGKDVFSLSKRDLPYAFDGIKFVKEEDVYIFAEIGVEISLDEDDDIVSYVFVHCKGY